MKDKFGIRKQIILMFTVLIFMGMYLPVSFADSPTEDGFPVATENAQITFINNMTLEVGGSSSSISSCSQPSPPSDSSGRAGCIDYLTSDLFVILKTQSSPSWFPAFNDDAQLLQFFEHIKKPQSNDGLSVAVHPLKQEPPVSSRIVSGNQNAIRVTQMDDHWSEGDILGYSTIGTPNTAGETQVYTYRIFEYICDTCGGTPNPGTPPTCSGGYFQPPQGHDRCRTSTGLLGDQLRDAYIRYINQHEIGHSVDLNHGGTDENIMYPTPKVKKVRGRWTFYLPEKYSDTSQQNMDLD